MRFKILVVMLLVLPVLACKHSNPSGSNTDGVIIASVTQTGNLPEPGKQIELVEKNDTLTTDTNGEAKFIVAPGAYTVRGFAMNHGGPVYQYEDSTVVVRAGDTARVRFRDCPECL